MLYPLSVPSAVAPIVKCSKKEKAEICEKLCDSDAVGTNLRPWESPTTLDHFALAFPIQVLPVGCSANV